MINIVLVDDHELVRTGFRMILQQHLISASSARPAMPRKDCG